MIIKPLLDITDLTVSFHTYAGPVRAVSGVSFQVFPGETVGIVGESGCGKSVTAHSIMRLIPTPPGQYDSGRITFDGADLLKKSEYELKKIRGNAIGMIFQDAMTALNPVLTIGSQITEQLFAHKKLSGQAASLQAAELLRMVGIPLPEERLNNYPHQFSGGMRQRAMIAMALSCQPRLLIADEPTTALDVTIQAQILDLLKELQARLKTSVILISHDLGAIAGQCQRVLVMYAGKIVESGTALDIFHHPLHPYTRGLLKSVPRLDADRKTPLTAIDGQPPDLLQPPAGCHFHPRCPHAMQICAEHYPRLTPIGGHSVHCWLQHPAAPRINREDFCNVRN